MASIDQIDVKELDWQGYDEFKILESESAQSEFQPISPDIAICDDCLKELRDPNDRRFRYPFINCTNCGPRFTIIHDIPYDRPTTSMSVFKMCDDCAAEYQDPTNRRFHAQPIACTKCGPQIWLELSNRQDLENKSENFQIGEEALQSTRNLLLGGKIIAIKGLGGFHLACDASNTSTINELRKRKKRNGKPFAVMMPDLKTIKRYCFVSEIESKLLESTAHPIVLLSKKQGSTIAANVAPGQQTIGVMLPYTPIHYLLLEKGGSYPDVLVMTSGNLSEEPICIDNSKARKALSTIADAFLMHDREIIVPADDSVIRIFRGNPFPVRRSRGQTPFPIMLPWKVHQILATGSELKNTFCITKNNYAFLSQHIGDMENYETVKSFEENVRHFEGLFRSTLDAIVCDRHPNYMATRYAIERAENQNIHIIKVQHHHAHIASTMAEHGLDGSRQVIGVAFDGTGYGDDGAIWGGEFFISDYNGYNRIAHLKYFPLPGGDVSIRRPSRTALGLLYSLGIDWEYARESLHDLSLIEQKVLFNQLEKNINCFPTSSIGRLFDAASSLAGICQQVNYEAQAAMEFESICDPNEMGLFKFEFRDGVIDPKSAIEELILDLNSSINLGKISGKFHNGLANTVLDICCKTRKDTGLNDVVLSGGVWQNITLLEKTMALLEQNGFIIYIHRKVPSNDGGIALGQAAIAAYQLQQH